MNSFMRSLLILLCCCCLTAIPSAVLAIGEGGKNPSTGTNEPYCPGCRTTSSHDDHFGKCKVCISGGGDICIRAAYGPDCSG